MTSAPQPSGLPDAFRRVSEPITQVARRYGRKVSLETAAAELGFQRGQLKNTLTRLPAAAGRAFAPAAARPTHRPSQLGASFPPHRPSARPRGALLRQES